MKALDKISSFEAADNIINRILYLGDHNILLRFSKTIYKTYFINNISIKENIKYVNCLSTDKYILEHLYDILYDCDQDTIIIFDNFNSQPHLIKTFKTFKYIFI